MADLLAETPWEEQSEAEEGGGHGGGAPANSYWSPRDRAFIPLIIPYTGGPIKETKEGVVITLRSPVPKGFILWSPDNPTIGDQTLLRNE